MTPSRHPCPSRPPASPRLCSTPPTAQSRPRDPSSPGARTRRTFAACWPALALTFTCAALAQDKTTYADHVRPLLQSRCFSCHNPDKKKGGLDVTSYAGLLAGGSGGSVADGGNHSGSRLWTLTARKAEPFMPPDGDPLKPAELDLLARWIDGGLLETSSSVAKKSDKPKLDLVVTSTGKPEGPPPMPEHLLLEPVLVAERGNAVTALAASPWAPLLAVGGAKQVLLYQADTLDLAGVLPYPEGFPTSLRFSRNGALLVASGGRGALLGNVVLFDVKSGRRVAEIGKELDAILSADLRCNHSMVAFGTPGKKLKVCDAAGNELYVKDKHSDWVTAVAFSPDGVLLASGDRNGGLRVWESDTGGEYLNLEAHKGAITGLAWRPDSNVLASSSEDGEVILWEMNNGGIVKRWTAHGGGTLSVAYAHDGKLVTSGRDRRVKTWKGDGALIKDIADTGDLPTQVAFLHDNARVAAGVWNGDVAIWRHDSDQALGRTTQNPPNLQSRIAARERRLAELAPQVQAAEQARAAAAQTLAATEQSAASFRKQSAEAKARAAQARQEMAALETQLAEARQKQTNAWTAMETHRTTLQKYASAQAQTAALERRAAETQTQADALRKQIAEAQGDQAKQAPLTAKLAPLDQAAKQAGAELEAARTAMGPAPAPLTESAQRVQETDRAVADLDLARRSKLDAATAQEAASAEAEKQAAALAPRLDEQRKDLESKNAAWQRLADDAAANTRALAALNAARFNVAVLAEKDQLSRLEVEFNARKSALDTARATQAEAETKLTEARTLIAKIDQNLPAMEAAVTRLGQELGTLESTVDPLRKTVPDLKTRATQARETAAARQKDLAAATASLEDMKSLKPPAASPTEASGVPELDQTRQQLAGAEKALADQIAAVGKLRADLARQATNAWNTAAGLAADAEKALAGLEAKVAELDKAITAKKGEVTQAIAARDDSKQKRQAAADALPRLEPALAEARKHADDAQASAAQAEQAFTAQKAKVDQLHTQYLALLPK